MKKFSSVLLILCLILTLSATLVSCGHECEFSPLWTGDATSHWHACKGEKCTEIADKADHTWDEGKITAWATQDAPGTKTFTCKVCALTKTESIAFAGMTETEWNAAFGSHLFENFEYKEVSSATVSDVTTTTEMTFKFTKDTAWGKMTVGEDFQEAYAPDLDAANEMRTDLVNSILALVDFESYQYDAATKTYKATTEIAIAAFTEVAGAEVTTSDITLTFANNKLAEIKYSVSFTKDEIACTATSTVTLSNYGTIVLTPPAPETPAQ